MTKWVYRFGDGAAEGRADMKNLLGGKGAGLAEMSNLGLPVPPGFTITTEVCTYFYAHGKSYPDELKDQVTDGLAVLERSLGGLDQDMIDTGLAIGGEAGAECGVILAIPPVAQRDREIGLRPLFAQAVDEGCGFLGRESRAVPAVEPQRVLYEAFEHAYGCGSGSQ